jgi:hypothetical protein
MKNYSLATIIHLIFLTLLISQKVIGQPQKLISEEQWDIEHFQGSCYHDTIIHAIWLYIDPDQTLQSYDKDTSFVVVEVTAVNKSPIDIFYSGYDNMLNTIVTKEYRVVDTLRMKHRKKRTQINLSRNQSGILHGFPPMKMESSLAFNKSDYKNNPHRFLNDLELKNKLIEIPKNSKRKLLITIPKRKGQYRMSMVVEFNREKFAYDCEGQKVTWETDRIIKSNKIELYNTK